MKKLVFILVLLLSLGAIWPFFRPGFFLVHDDTQVERVYEMGQALRDGQFPVRWVADLGYGFGYPLFNFYAPLAYYVGGLLNFLGFNVLLATKIMFATGILLSGIFMYSLAEEFWGRWGGIVAALFYVYAPYHALDVYVRGAVGEFWAMAFLPLVFLGLYLIYQNYRRGVIVAGLGFAAVILSHNLTAMMTLIFIFITSVLSFLLTRTKKKYVINWLWFVLLSLGVTAFYWLPALTEMNLTKVSGQVGGGANFRDHFVYLDQLWASPWGFGGSAPGRLDGMSFTVGKIHLLTWFVSFLLLFPSRLKKKKLIIGITFSTAFLFLSVFFTNEISRFVWELIGPMAFIQYPWRFLTFAILGVSFSVGVLVFNIRRYKVGVILLSIFLFSMLLIFNLRYFSPQTNSLIVGRDYQSMENLKWRASRVSDEYLPRGFISPTDKDGVAWEKIEILTGKMTLMNQVLKSDYQRFDFDVNENGSVLLKTAFFPNWQVKLDGVKIEPQKRPDGVETFLLSGSRKLEATLTNTTVENLANLVSLASLAFLGLFVVKFGHERVGSGRS